MNQVHHLKTWPDVFEDVIAGRKPFEVRKDDRGYQVGDWLVLEEWSPETKEYTGRACDAEVTYLLRGGQFGIEAGYVVMTLGRHGDDTNLRAELDEAIQQRNDTFEAEKAACARERALLEENYDLKRKLGLI